MPLEDARCINLTVNLNILVYFVGILHFGGCFSVGFFLTPHFFLTKEEVFQGVRFFQMDTLAMCPKTPFVRWFCCVVCNRLVWYVRSLFLAQTQL